MAAVPRRAALGASLLRAHARPVICVSNRFAAASTAATAGPALTAARRPAVAASAPVFGSLGARRWYIRNKPHGQGPLEDVKEWTYEDIIEELEKNEQDPLRNRKQKAVFIDVREAPELEATGWIPGAVNIPITSGVQSFHIHPTEFEMMLGYKRPPPDVPVVMYCKAGVRALSAAGLAVHAGYDHVGVYRGSWNEWAARGGPVSHDKSHYRRIPDQPDAEVMKWDSLDDTKGRAKRTAATDAAEERAMRKARKGQMSPEEALLAEVDREYKEVQRSMKEDDEEEVYRPAMAKRPLSKSRTGPY